MCVCACHLTSTYKARSSKSRSMHFLVSPSHCLRNNSPWRAEGESSLLLALDYLDR
jgi:hypothetical protein